LRTGEEGACSLLRFGVFRDESKKLPRVNSLLKVEVVLIPFPDHGAWEFQIRDVVMGGGCHKFAARKLFTGEKPAVCEAFWSSAKLGSNSSSSLWRLLSNQQSE